MMADNDRPDRMTKRMFTLDQAAIDALELLKAKYYTDNASYIVRLALIHEAERIDDKAPGAFKSER